MPKLRAIKGHTFKTSQRAFVIKTNIFINIIIKDYDK